MHAHRIETKVAPDGTLKLEGLPFAPGSPIEVIILARGDVSSGYPLRGAPLEYQDPTEPVAADEWEQGR